MKLNRSRVKQNEDQDKKVASPEVISVGGWLKRKSERNRAELGLGIKKDYYY